ncbi:MAG: GAF domain-containing protein [Pseudomonadota bacterium]|nr:GAF domain-containing protein [Pseudomonadota bacterium]
MTAQSVDQSVALQRRIAELEGQLAARTRELSEAQAREAAKTRDFEEALAQQTATAQVLKAISRSAFDLQAVFDALLASAVDLVGGIGGAIALREGDELRFQAGANPGGVWPTDFVGRVIPIDRTSAAGRAAGSGRLEYIPDADLDPEFHRVASGAWGQSYLGAPLVRDGRVEGALTIISARRNAFTQRHIDLVQTFADQALIAIENTRLFNEVQARTRDLADALAQQTATAEVLKVISRSAFDLDAVLNSLTRSAVELCDSTLGVISLYRDGKLVFLAQFGCSPEFADFLWRHPITPDRKTVAGRAALSLRVEQVADVTLDADYDYQGGETIGNYRSGMAAPLTRDGKLEGVFNLMRREPGLYTNRQVELVQTFADQAVIAIENVRLFEEVQTRTRDLSEALAQQTATADVLKVISSSAFNLQPVFDAMAENAVRLCEAERAVIFQFDGNLLHAVATHNVGPELRQFLDQNPIVPGRTSISARAALHKRTVQIADAQSDPDYSYAARDVDLIRAIAAIPMLKGDQLVGTITIYKLEATPFTDKHIRLVETFAEQAVIAIENVRLFEEVQARTRDLTEALQQQTATADVLKVISRSAFDLQAVLDTLVRSAVELCGAFRGSMFLRDGDLFRFRANFSATPHLEWIAYLKEHPHRAGRGSTVGRAITAGVTVCVPDLLDDPEIEYPGTSLAKIRAVLAVPMLREGRVEGVMGLSRTTPGAFSARQVELVETFADQAVIAIENARLFDEVQARTRELSEALVHQTATANILKVIAASPTNVAPVLQAIAESACEVCGAYDAVVALREGDFLRFSAHHGPIPLGIERWPLNRRFVNGRAVLDRTPVHVPDLQLAGDEFPEGREMALRMGFRTNLAVPLLREGESVGAIGVRRMEAQPFSDKQIEVLQSFADQAVIAIHNVRLFDEVQAKTRDLEESLQQQTATAEVLKVISRSAFDLDAIFQTLVTTAVDLCKASSGTLCVLDGAVYRYRGMAGPEATPALQSYLEAHPLATPTRATAAGRAILSRQVEQIADVLQEPDYAVPFAAQGSSARALLAVPLLGKAEVQGAIVVARAEPGAFPPRHVEILRTFADQAVIAIENSRLFAQVQARTRELEQSLDDLRRTQDRLVQSEKLASLGQLTAGIAHEIKNPLNFVNNFSSLSRDLLIELSELLAKAKLAEDERKEGGELIGMIGSNLDKVVSHGKRADSIVKNMLLHSREGSGERSSVNVNAMVEEALNLAYHGARAEKPGFNVTIARSLDARAGLADLYHQEMTRVLLNLISNGFYATSKRMQSEPGAYEPTLAVSTRDLGDQVEICLRDNGTGISEEVKAKMFNPFFTTKPAGEGTGLGLSLSHDIVVKQHGGTIDVASEPGAYTQFTIRLPRGGKAA